MMRSLTYRKCRPEDYPEIRSLLEHGGLPHSDVGKSPVDFHFFYKDQILVGLSGLEDLGTWGLIRSVVVKDEHKGRGLGKEITGITQQIALEKGIEVLYFLTNDSDPFFEKMGYQVISRGEVPESVKATTQFQELCPDSAICMSKDLRLEIQG